MRGSFFLIATDKIVTLYTKSNSTSAATVENGKEVVSAAIPGALATYHIKTYFWDMTVTTEMVVIKYNEVTVFMRLLKEIEKEVAVSVEIASEDYLKGFLRGIILGYFCLVAVLIAIFIMSFFFYGPLMNRLFTSTRVFHGGLNQNLEMDYLDLICKKGTFECATIPAFLRSTFFALTVSRLILQTDGNLVLYNFWGNAVWSSNTQGKNCDLFTFEGNGLYKLHCKGTDSILYDDAGEKKKEKASVEFECKAGDYREIIKVDNGKKYVSPLESGQKIGFDDVFCDEKGQNCVIKGH